MTVNAVIFDMDGLMLDSEKLYLETNQEVAAEMGFEFTLEFYTQFIGSDDRIYREGVHELLQDEEFANEFLEEAQRRLHEKFYAGEVDLKPGLIELLEYLTENDIPAIVASSTHLDMVKHLMDIKGLTHYFKSMTGGNQVETAKPEPEIFLKAAETLDVQKSEMLILEDSLNGVRAGYAANIPVIMVPDYVKPDDEAREKTVAILDDLFQVKAYISQQ